MIKALLNSLSCKNTIENHPPYSFSIAHYDDEHEIYLDIKNIDISIGVPKYSTKNIMTACTNALHDYNETRNFLSYFLEKFFEKNKVKESTLYLELDDKVIRIRNISINNHNVLRVSINREN